MKTIAKRLVILGCVAFSVGCSQGHSTSGVEGTSERLSVAPGGAQSSPRTIALGHTAYPGRVVRWPSRTISVNINKPWVKKAARMWRKKGFKFRLGRRGGIKFGGYNSTMSAVGRAWFSYKGGKIYKCTILLNPRYFHRYPIELTMAHEIGHCLGMTGHIEGGLMSRYAGKTRIKPDTVKFFNYIYARKPGAKL